MTNKEIIQTAKAINDLPDTDFANFFAEIGKLNNIDNTGDFCKRLTDAIQEASDNKNVYERLLDDFTSFKNEVSRKSPEEVFSMAYEITLKENIMGAFEGDCDFSDDVINFFQNYDSNCNLLNYLYESWLDGDESFMTLIRENVENFVWEESCQKD